MKGSHKKALILGGYVLVGGVLLFSFACKGKSAQEERAARLAEKTLQEQTGQEAKVDIQGGHIRIQIGEEKAEVRQTKEWMADIPAEVPPFTLGKVQGVTAGEREGKKSWNIVVDEVQKGAFNAYLESLKAKGWKITSTLTMGERGTISATKANLDVVALFQGDRHSAVITVVQK